jgi:hypothetical protein
LRSSSSGLKEKNQRNGRYRNANLHRLYLPRCIARSG